MPYPSPYSKVNFTGPGSNPPIYKYQLNPIDGVECPGYENRTVVGLRLPPCASAVPSASAHAPHPHLAVTSEQMCQYADFPRDCGDYKAVSPPQQPEYA